MCYKDQSIHRFLGESCKTEFFTYREKVSFSARSQLQQLLEQKQASSSCAPPFILSQLFFSPAGGQSSEAASCWQHFFQGTQQANSLCRQNGKSDLVLCRWVQEKKNWPLGKHNHWKCIDYSTWSCLQNVFALYDILYQDWRSQNMILQFCFFYLQCRKEKWKRTGGRAQGRLLKKPHKHNKVWTGCCNTWHSGDQKQVRDTFTAQSTSQNV